MAPFYSTLSIWVGGIVLVAMMKVTLSEERKKKLHHVKNYQIYFGRYLLFFIMGLIQSGFNSVWEIYSFWVFNVSIRFYLYCQAGLPVSCM